MTTDRFFDKYSDSGWISFFPEGVRKPKVAVIGVGIFGLVVASELLYAGVDDVTIYEASDRIGGKLWSHAFKDASSVVAEMGAMRFPPTSSCLFFFLKRQACLRWGRSQIPAQSTLSWSTRVAYTCEKSGNSHRSCSIAFTADGMCS